MAVVAVVAVGIIAAVIGVIARDRSIDSTDAPVPAPRRGPFPGENVSPEPEPEPEPAIAGRTSNVAAADPPGVTPIDIDFIEVPTALRSIEPTEVVALSPDHGLVEVSLPSGRVRTTDLRFFTGQARLATTDFGALVLPTGSTAPPQQLYSLVPIGQQPLTVIGANAVGDVASTPGRDGFVLWSESESGATAIRSNGAVVPAEWARRGDRPAMDPAGRLLDEGPGGLFATDALGSGRLSTGDLVATGRNHVLLHECDDDRACALVVLDAAGGRTVGADTARFDSDHPLWSATPDGLAPDGSTFLAVADAEQRGLVVVSVADGSVQSVHASSTFELDGAWAGDSTGVFFADGDLRFWSRADGSVVSLADEVTTVRAVSTRHPATSPICEHVGAIVESFAAMRTGAEIGAPSRRVLDGLRMFAPDALADDTAALVTFVDSFVSAERTDSERIENWPANVTAGIEAIERFDDTDC